MKARILTALSFAIAAITLMTVAVHAQPDTLWTRTFGGSSYDYGYSVQQTTDGGYIIAGLTSSYGADSSDVYLIKTDGDGNEQWYQTFGGSNYDSGESVQQTSDGGYIIAGYTCSYGAGYNDVYLIKTDSSGYEQWSQTFGGGNDDWGKSVKQTTDGGYIIAGKTQSYGAGDWDVYLIKTDANGNTMWTRTFGGTSPDMGNGVQQNLDGEYIIAGMTESYGAGSADAYLIKTDANGIEQWSQTYGDSGWDQANDLQKSLPLHPFPHGWILVGEHSFEDWLLWMWLVDADGDTTWTRGDDPPSIPNASSSGNSIWQTSDSGYIAAGYIGISSDLDVRLIKTDADGYIMWTQTLGGTSNDVGECIQQTSDGGYIVVGGTESYGAGLSDVYLIRLEAESGQLPVSLTPYNPPIIIPANGGSFDYNIEITNIGSSPVTFDVWVNVEIPAGIQFPVLGPVYDLTLPGETSIDRDRSLSVPGDAPGGEYIVLGSVGTYPWIAVDTDSFTFTKEGTTGDGLLINPTGWFCTGEPFPGETAQSSHPSSFILHPCTPNPFNPATVIRFQMQDASIVNLSVYDISGRLVAELVNAWRDAGVHEVAFDGSDLSSGVYLYRLTAGEFTNTGKMVLMK
ncbi:hypothetical protein CEE37_14095 [candidate division LCP-89 bacterium B3_LCP]|uniref:Secretion system C-terminal sorting domain-containing protein n=1 Tax=candidate division LCP-89 bacterium B3_LCP TaxID=2012998 RepID=A0A532UQL6_UNCL8|nr:MAG: hypothetical protein CEE37_14095 [candidate division LCP-89 bacterium B3_LCP]